jgi:fatty-acyl-CoA synthase
MVNLSSFIFAHAKRSPDRIALVYDGERISYREFARRIKILAGWLTARGLGRDDVVAVLMKNSAAFLEIAFAVSHIGGVFLPINFRLAGDEVRYVVENSGAKLLLVDDELVANASGAPAVAIDERAQRDATVLCGEHGRPKVLRA